MFIYPYRRGSRSVRALADALEARIIRLENSNFRGNKDKVVINWGNSMTNEEIEKANVINRPECIELATNKKTFFQTVRDQVNIPNFTTDKETAASWIEAGKSVVVREKLQGYGGEGIVLLQNTQEWDEYSHELAKLYVEYIPKRDEYRVHVVNGEVVDTQRKAKIRDLPREEVNFQIRNHANGFIFARNEDREVPEDVHTQSINAVKLCDLHFGAVDVVYNQYRDKAYVLEINTAPGLEGSTIDTYAKAFKKMTLDDLLEQAEWRRDRGFRPQFVRGQQDGVEMPEEPNRPQGYDLEQLVIDNRV